MHNEHANGQGILGLWYQNNDTAIASDTPTLLYKLSCFVTPSKLCNFHFQSVK